MRNSSNHLVLDVGNTHIKYGYFENDRLDKSGVCTLWTEAQWHTFHQQNPFESVLVGAVGNATKPLLAKIPKSCSIHIVDNTTNYPFTSVYDNMQDLGVDRKAALAGALKTHPNTSVLVIDAGSCITYDYMNSNAMHLGGAISPGRAMRYHAMHLFTNQLPHLTPTEKIPTIGTSTKSSMELGVELSVIAEIKEHITAFAQEYGNFTIILTGGDAKFLNKKIKNPIFAVADLTLIGLYHLLMFNSFHEK